MWYEHRKRIEEFIKNGKNAVIIHHNDVDGICSAFLTKKWAEKKFEKIEVMSSHPGKPFLVPKLYEQVVKAEPDFAIFVDMAVDQDPEPIKRLSKKIKVIIIDHHLVNKDLNCERIVHVNHHLDGIKKYTPASKMCYDLFEGENWVAAVGVIADSGAKQWIKFIRNVNQEYGTSGTDFESSLGMIANVINSLRVKGNMFWTRLALEVLETAKTPFDIINQKTSAAKEAWQIYEKVNKKIQKLVNDFPDKADVRGDLAFYEIGKGFYGGTIATILSKKYGDMTIIIVQKDKSDTVFLNFRRNDKKVDVSSLVQEATLGMDKASGGGHVAAAGGTLQKKDYETFKTRVLSILGK
ncbi:MAG: DHH family phosphoesterase [Nanoarchaeota archaeon]|nr:DHH family phosphoesterase [Nanoarchaeota archaeon]